MIIAIIFIIFIKLLISNTICRRRRSTAILTLFVYLSISIIDMIWLFNVENAPLHPSDPINYFYNAINHPFSEVFEEGHSNMLYPIINWVMTRFWSNPYWFCLLIKIDNSLLAIIIYLLLTCKNPRLTIFDYIILFNPYLILTLNRNVRDLYIILFVLLIFIGIGVIHSIRINKFWLFVSILLLAITRAILIAPLLVVWFSMQWTKLSNAQKFFVLITIILISIAGLEIMIKESMNQMISSMSYSGQDYEDLRPLLYGEYSLSAWFAFCKKFIMAFSVFLFTPNPLNHIVEWYRSMTETGASNIYTGFDNLLILLGSIYYYVFVVPYIINAFYNYTKYNHQLLLFSVLFAVLYSVSYLGQTDIRNHNTFIYFFLASILYSKYRIKIHIKDCMGSILLCLGIHKFSSK